MEQLEQLLLGLLADDNLEKYLGNIVDRIPDERQHT